MSAAAEHPGQDAALLDACEAFYATHAEMKTPRRGQTEADDEALAAVIRRWYAQLDAAVTIPARTAAGQQAKLHLVYVALDEAMHDEPADSHREEFAALTALRELLGDAAPLPAKRVAAPATSQRALSVLEIGHHLRAADDRFCASDAHCMEAPDETPEQRAARVQHDGWDLNELLGWRQLAFCRQPVTLLDAAAQLAILYDHVADLDTSTIDGRPDAFLLVADIKTTVRVVASLAVTVARIAGLDVRTVVDDDLPHRLGKHVPVLDGLVGRA